MLLFALRLLHQRLTDFVDSSRAINFELLHLIPDIPRSSPCRATLHFTLIEWNLLLQDHQASSYVSEQTAFVRVFLI